MQRFIKIVGNGRKTARSLTAEEACEALTLILEGCASPAQVGAFLAALRLKEETGTELAAFAATLRRYSRIMPVDRPTLVDLAVPYDGRSRSYPLLIAAGCIAAAVGAAVAFHGRPGQITPPKFGLGLSEVLAELGIPVDLSLESAAQQLEDPALGLAFVPVAHFSPTLERFNALRLEYGLRSFFNSIEKLLNPFDAPAGIAGVFHSPVLPRVAEAMAGQGFKRGVVVHGPEGAPEVWPSRLTKLVEFRDGEAPFSWTINPADFGGRMAQESEESEEEVTLQPAVGAKLTLAILQPGPEREVDFRQERQGALLSAAFMLYAAGQSASLAEGLEQAREAVNSGVALARLKRWQKVPAEMRRNF